MEQTRGQGGRLGRMKEWSRRHWRWFVYVLSCLLVTKVGAVYLVESQVHRAPEGARPHLVVLERRIWQNPQEQPPWPHSDPDRASMPVLRCGGERYVLPNFGVPSRIITPEALGSPKLPWLARDLSPAVLARYTQGEWRAAVDGEPDPSTNAWYGYLLANAHRWELAEVYWRRASRDKRLAKLLHIPLYVAYCRLREARKAESCLLSALRCSCGADGLWAASQHTADYAARKQRGERGAAGVCPPDVARTLDALRFTQDELWAERIWAPPAGQANRDRLLCDAYRRHESGQSCARLETCPDEGEGPKQEAEWPSAPTCLDPWGEGTHCSAPETLSAQNEGQGAFPARFTQTAGRCTVETEALSIGVEQMTRAQVIENWGADSIPSAEQTVAAPYWQVTVTEKVRVTGEASDFRGLAIGWRFSFLPSSPSQREGAPDHFAHGFILVKTEVKKGSDSPMLHGVEGDDPKSVRFGSPGHAHHCAFCKETAGEGGDCPCQWPHYPGDDPTVSVLKFRSGKVQTGGISIRYEATHTGLIPVTRLWGAEADAARARDPLPVRISLLSIPRSAPEGMPVRVVWPKGWTAAAGASGTLRRELREWWEGGASIYALKQPWNVAFTPPRRVAIGASWVCLLTFLVLLSTGVMWYGLDHPRWRPGVRRCCLVLPFALPLALLHCAFGDSCLPARWVSELAARSGAYWRSPSWLLMAICAATLVSQVFRYEHAQRAARGAEIAPGASFAPCCPAVFSLFTVDVFAVVLSGGMLWASCDSSVQSLPRYVAILATTGSLCLTGMAYSRRPDRVPAWTLLVFLFLAWAAWLVDRIAEDAPLLLSQAIPLFAEVEPRTLRPPLEMWGWIWCVFLIGYGLQRLWLRGRIHLGIVNDIHVWLEAWLRPRALGVIGLVLSVFQILLAALQLVLKR